MVFPPASIYWTQRKAQRSGKNRAAMDEEEFSANDVWFGDRFRYTESQGLELIEDTPLGHEIAAEEAVVGEVVGPSQDENLSTEIPTKNPEIEGVLTAAALQEDVDSAEEDDLGLKPKAKRNYTSYAKKIWFLHRRIYSLTRCMLTK
jgi:hypothetical protein